MIDKKYDHKQVEKDKYETWLKSKLLLAEIKAKNHFV